MEERKDRGENTEEKMLRKDRVKYRVRDGEKYGGGKAEEKSRRQIRVT